VQTPRNAPRWVELFTAAERPDLWQSAPPTVSRRLARCRRPYDRDMTKNELIAFISELDAVETVVASADNGAPESSWGDVFFSVTGQRFPFATIVLRDQPGFDESSRLDRDGVFRLNIAVGREAVRQRFGPDDHHDPAALDRLVPHPVYASHGWVSVLNPDTTADEVRGLLQSAHTRATS
jgi:hypothetical protein